MSNRMLSIGLGRTSSDPLTKWLGLLIKAYGQCRLLYCLNVAAVLSYHALSVKKSIACNRKEECNLSLAKISVGTACYWRKRVTMFTMYILRKACATCNLHSGISHENYTNFVNSTSTILHWRKLNLKNIARTHVAAWMSGFPFKLGVFYALLG